MLKILLAVDGSDNAVRATQTLIQSLGWYKQPPQIDLLTVHLPVPEIGGMRAAVSQDMIERYYREECEANLAPSKKLLDAAGVKYNQHSAIGPVAETIVDEAKKHGSNMIYMGTRGMTAVSNMLLGSIATKVIHLSRVPVVLVH